MGFIKSIGKAFKSIGHVVGNVAKGVVKFAKSPIGKLLINVGLSFVTGGVGGLLSKGLSMLGGVGSSIGSAVSTFGGFASKFLNTAQSFMSNTGLSSIAGFLGKATNTTDLLGMAQSIFASRQQAPQVDDTSNDIVNSNLAQLFAAAQAQLMMDV